MISNHFVLFILDWLVAVGYEKAGKKQANKKRQSRQKTLCNFRSERVLWKRQEEELKRTNENNRGGTRKRMCIWERRWAGGRKGERFLATKVYTH